MRDVKHLEPYMFDKKSPEERRALAAKGGKASALERRRRRALREAADFFLSMPVQDKEAARMLRKAGVDEEDMDNQMAIIAALALRAARGDTKAAKMILNLADVSAERAPLEVRIVDDL